ncbi:SLAP domain-containing protein [Lactobacillus panisapium]|uniref:SLAP domain-containing protein n=1 Tax=Lactobacillus panisapium TaxID=2012495 RepID=UPI000CDADB48|nr:SLAP domain-containing protein [Lactobacillus panisapium]
MKKNLRIVSAAAAALLAVAPVAATSVSTAFADNINVPVTGTASQSDDTAKLVLNVTNVGSLVEKASASTVQATLSTPVLPKNASVHTGNAQIYAVTKDKDGKVPKIDPSKASSETQLALNTDYVAVTTVSITGLDPKIKYSINGDTAVNPDASGTIANIVVQSDSFRIPNTSLKGAPYVYDKTDTSTNKTAITAGTIPLTSSNSSVTELVKSINDRFDVKVTAQGADAAKSAKFADLEGDVRAALKNAGITVKTDPKGSFDKPAAPFLATLNIIAENGSKGTFALTVDPTSSDVADSSYPVISYYVKGDTANPVKVPNITTSNTTDASSKTIENIDDVLDSSKKPISFNYVPVNGVVDTTAIKDAFTATVATNNADKLAVNVDISKVNTKVAGKYPVVISATNADKKTSKVTFYITVGVKGATYKTVQSDGDVPVYKIEGNNVTDTKTTVKNGDQIAVFGDAIKVGDKSYTRINSADSNLYVETKYVDGSFKPAEKTSKTVMHNAYIYDKDHKRVGTNMLRAYTKVDVLGAATKLADGSLVYQIGDNQYVMADNIDGTVRTLSHNAYVYKTSKKRADSRVLRKGAKVTTYGSPYTFKNGKAYYRIGGPSKQYVKVANFN